MYHAYNIKSPTRKITKKGIRRHPYDVWVCLAELYPEMKELTYEVAKIKLIDKGWQVGKIGFINKQPIGVS